MEHADTKIKLAMLIDALRKEAFVNRPWKWIILGPFISTDEQLNPNFTTYIRGEIFNRMDGRDLFNTMDRGDFLLQSSIHLISIGR